MSDEKFCIGCEKKLSELTGAPLGEICPDCYKTLRRPKAKPREMVVVFPIVCPHETCRTHDPEAVPKQFGVLVLNKKHQWTWVDGPFTKRKAAAEAGRIRAEAARMAKGRKR